MFSNSQSLKNGYKLKMTYEQKSIQIDLCKRIFNLEAKINRNFAFLWNYKVRFTKRVNSCSNMISTNSAQKHYILLEKH